MRTVANDDEDDDEGDASGVRNHDLGDHDDQDVHGVHAHKAVVGPDELLPGEQEPMPKNGEKMVGFTQALMWLPAIFDVSNSIFVSFDCHSQRPILHMTMLAKNSADCFPYGLCRSAVRLL